MPNWTPDEQLTFDIAFAFKNDPRLPEGAIRGRPLLHRQDGHRALETVPLGIFKTSRSGSMKGRPVIRLLYDRIETPDRIKPTLQRRGHFDHHHLKGWPHMSFK